MRRKLYICLEESTPNYTHSILCLSNLGIKCGTCDVVTSHKSC